MMTKKTTKTKTRTRPNLSKVNAVDFQSGEFADPINNVEVWRVQVHDTGEVYFNGNKADVLNYISRKAAKSFSLKQMKIDYNVLVS